MSMGCLPQRWWLPRSPLDDGDLGAQGGDLGALLGTNFTQQLGDLLEHGD
jgi:hypothetical protein